MAHGSSHFEFDSHHAVEMPSTVGRAVVSFEAESFSVESFWVESFWVPTFSADSFLELFLELFLGLESLVSESIWVLDWGCSGSWLPAPVFSVAA